MEIVLGMSMAPASIQMVVLEGEYADGATVEEDVFDVPAAEDAATASAPDQVIAAILGTREGATDAGLELSSIGVTWTDQLEAAALRDALAAHRIDNVMLVSAFLAAAALAQNVGGAMGYERTGILFVEPDTATLAVVETSDGSIPDVYRQPIYAESYDDAAAQLNGIVAGLEKLVTAPDGLFVVGSGVDIAPLRPALQSATALAVSMADEPETALARGAALASANAPLFASSTAALAYAQDPGTGAVDQYAMPDYLYVPFGSEHDDDRAYSAVPDEDADSPTVIIEKLFMPEESQPRRGPALLIGSGLAVAAISAVLALEVALAIGIRATGTVGLQPTPGQHLIVPTQQPSAAHVEASAPAAKISLPAPMAAPRPLNPPVAAPLPAVPAPAAPPAAPVPIDPLRSVPVVIPPPVLLPPVHVPVPNPVVSPPVIQAPPHVTPPQPVVPQQPVHVPQPPQASGTVRQSPPHQVSPGQGPLPNGGDHVPTPGTGPGSSGGGHVLPPGEGPGGLGGGHVSPPGEGPGGLGVGHVSPPGEGLSGLGGGHVPAPGSGGGEPAGPGLFGGGGHPGGEPSGGGGGGGGFGGGHSGGSFGGGGGGGGGGHSGGGGRHH